MKFPGKIKRIILLTNDGVILREVSDLVDVNVSAVSVVQLHQDVVVVVVRSHHRAWVEVAQLTAPVDTDPPSQLQLGDSLGPDLSDLRGEQGLIFR